MRLGTVRLEGENMKRLILLMLTLLLLSGCARQEEGKMSYTQISMEEAVEMMAEENGYIILDVRTEAEFAQKHIPGAVNLPNEQIGSGEIDILPDKEQLILVYCRSGNRSKQAAANLAAQGYGNVVEFGGIIDWPGETKSAEG